jgi:hypothetical protein
VIHVEIMLANMLLRRLRRWAAMAYEVEALRITLTTTADERDARLTVMEARNNKLRARLAEFEANKGVQHP